MKLLVTGGTGLVGNALKNIICDKKYEATFLSSKECDLTDYNSTYELFKKIKPDFVIHLAANVGGLFKNMNFKLDMLEKNLLINYNVLRCCHLLGVKKVIYQLVYSLIKQNIQLMKKCYMMDHHINQMMLMHMLKEC